MNKIVFLLLLSTAVQAQQFTTWSLDKGLPQSQVYAMCEDAFGYLWLGTQGGGVCRFDGQVFETWNEQDGLPSNFVQALVTDPKHSIWIGTTKGVAVLQNRTIKRLDETTHLSVNALVWLDPTTLLIGSNAGIWRCDISSGHCTQLPTTSVLDHAVVSAFYHEIETKKLWIATSQGVWCYRTNNQSVSNFHIQNKLPIVPVRAFARAGTALWFVQTDGTLIAVDPANQTLLSTRLFADLENATTLTSEPDGSLRVGTQAFGLFNLSPTGDSILSHITENEGLLHNHIRVLMHDHTGRLWVGSSGGGIACMGAQAFRRYDRTDGLAGNRIYALTENTAGDVWIAMSQNGLATMNALGQIQRSTADSGYLQGVKCRTLEHDQRGNLWAGTEGKGMVCIQPKGPIVFNKANGYLPSDWVQKICCDAQGTIWVATGMGIARIAYVAADSTFSKKWYTAKEGMPQGSITTLQIAADGTVWFGSANGQVGRIANGSVERLYGTEQGLPRLPITSIVFDSGQRCWISTKGAGIFVKNKEETASFLPFQSNAALTSLNIYLLVADQKGNIWAGHEQGVDQLVFDAGQFAGINHFGKQDGFTGIETCQDAGLCDQTGRLWFGTMNGLMRHIPDAPTQQRKPPLLHFEETKLFYKPIEQTDYAVQMSALFDGSANGLTLPWHQNHVSFSFKGIELLNDGPTLYRWKLEGSNAEWSPWTTQTQVNFANLAPGRYHLLVQVSSDEKIASDPISATFTIGKPFWQEWYFQAGILLLGGMLLAGAVGVYIQRIRRSEARQRAQLEIQNRLLQLEQKALQLQMNPHFIFNALNSIQSLIATNEYEGARTEINHFARLMRSILNNSRKSSITLQEEMDTLQEYLHIEQFCQRNKFTFAIQTPDALDLDSVEIPPMLLQPFVENAVIHGVSHLSYPGHIEIVFEIAGESLLCFVRDNGLGREAVARLQVARKSGHQSAALSVTQERLASMGGTLEIRDAVGHTGTDVAIMVPLLGLV